MRCVMSDPAALYFVHRFLSWYFWHQGGRELDEGLEPRAGVVVEDGMGWLLDPYMFTNHPHVGEDEVRDG